MNEKNGNQYALTSEGLLVFYDRYWLFAYHPFKINRYRRIGYIPS